MDGKGYADTCPSPTQMEPGLFLVRAGRKQHTLPPTEGWQAGLHMGVSHHPMSQGHHLAMQQGRIKGTASLPNRRPRDMQEQVLEEAVELLGGKKSGGWMRLLVAPHCKASLWQGQIQSPPDGRKYFFSL